MLKHHIILGSRGSILALAQTNWVKNNCNDTILSLPFPFKSSKHREIKT